MDDGGRGPQDINHHGHAARQSLRRRQLGQQMDLHITLPRHRHPLRKDAVTLARAILPNEGVGGIQGKGDLAGRTGDHPARREPAWRFALAARREPAWRFALAADFRYVILHSVTFQIKETHRAGRSERETPSRSTSRPVTTRPRTRSAAFGPP